MSRRPDRPVKLERARALLGAAESLGSQKPSLGATSLPDAIPHPARCGNSGVAGRFAEGPAKEAAPEVARREKESPPRCACMARFGQKTRGTRNPKPHDGRSPCTAPSLIARRLTIHSTGVALQSLRWTRSAGRAGGACRTRHPPRLAAGSTPSPFGRLPVDNNPDCI